MKTPYLLTGKAVLQLTGKPRLLLENKNPRKVPSEMPGRHHLQTES